MNVRTYNQLKPWKPKALRGCYLACAWLAGVHVNKTPDSGRRIRQAPSSQRPRLGDRSPSTE